MTLSFETTQKLAMVLCVGRVAVGLAPFVAADLTSKLLGFPPEANTPTSRLFARMFGVRDAALGVLVWHALGDINQLRWTFLFNAAMDAGDALSCLIPLVKKQGINRAAVMSMAMGVSGGTWFLVLWCLSG